MKILHETSDITKDYARVTKILHLDAPVMTGYKFKCVLDLSNGTSKVDVYLMDGDGVFQYVLNKLDLGFKFEASYMGNVSDKERVVKAAFALIDNVLPKIYA